MLKVIYTSSDQAVGQRIAEDFKQAGFEVGTDAPQQGDLAIFVLSQAALDDPAQQALLIGALDLSLHIVPVMTQRVDLPRLIDHLDALDFSGGYDFAALRQQVEFELSPGAPRPMRVRTPTVKRSNRTIGIVIAVVAIFMFVSGLYAVAVLHDQAPIQQFNTMDTLAAMTRDIIVAPVLQIYSQFLPQSSEEAANYLPTLMAVPTAYRPFMALTATAVVTTPTPPTQDDSDIGF